MPSAVVSPDEILETWTGMIDDHFQSTIAKTFALPNDDQTIYGAQPAAYTLAEIQEKLESGAYKYHYRDDHGAIEVASTDIHAYIDLFRSTTSTEKSLASFAANAKKHSPRSAVAAHLLSRRLLPPALRVPKRKAPHINPYLDLWAWSCLQTGFVGPLAAPAYASPSAARISHPTLPALYHHFGCACPSFEALTILSRLAGPAGIVDVGSGNGYWSLMLRRLGVSTTAIDNGLARWRTMWIDDTVSADGTSWLRSHGGASDRLLLLVYPIASETATGRLLRAFKGERVALVGTQNANRFTAFADATTEEYFTRERPEYELLVRVALPSFAGKDEALYVYQRKRS